MELQRIDLAGLQLDVVSVAGIESRVDIPAFDVAVDVGRGDVALARRRRVLLTHAHVDHLGGIAAHVGSRALWRLPPPVYFVPEEIRDEVELLLDVWRRLQRDAMPAEVRGVVAGERIPLGRDLDAIPFRTDHRVPSLGYMFVQRTRRLRADRVGLPGHVLATLRRQGVVLEDSTEEVVFAVTGDTCFEALLEVPEVLSAKRLMLEVTFLDERVERASARAKGHTHLDDLVEHAACLQNEALLLCHISTRYSTVEAERIVRERLPADLMERCTVLATDSLR